MPELAEYLERFRRGAEIAAVATTGASNPELDFVPEPGKWCSRQILCHLADSEIVGHMRFRQVIAEENPTLMVYDEAAWAEKLDYRKRKISVALETFRRIRAENYELLNSLDPAVFERAGTHSARGRVTLFDLLKTYAEHAEGHVRQIMAARQAYKQSKASA